MRTSDKIPSISIKSLQKRNFCYIVNLYKYIKAATGKVKHMDKVAESRSMAESRYRPVCLKVILEPQN